MALASIEHVTRSFCRQVGLSAELAILENAWEAEIGGVGAMARIRALECDTLVIEVDSSVVMQELTLQRRELLRRLNRHFMKPFLKALTIRISQHGH